MFRRLACLFKMKRKAGSLEATGVSSLGEDTKLFNRVCGISDVVRQKMDACETLIDMEAQEEERVRGVG